MGRCRDCALYGLDGVKNARGAIMSKRAAPCLWKSTETYPISVMENFRRPSPIWMEPNDGARCQRFIKRADA